MDRVVESKCGRWREKEEETKALEEVEERRGRGRWRKVDSVVESNCGGRWRIKKEEEIKLWKRWKRRGRVEWRRVESVVERNWARRKG